MRLLIALIFSIAAGSAWATCPTAVQLNTSCSDLKIKIEQSPVTISVTSPGLNMYGQVVSGVRSRAMDAYNSCLAQKCIQEFTARSSLTTRTDSGGQ